LAEVVITPPNKADVPVEVDPIPVGPSIAGRAIIPGTLVAEAPAPAGVAVTYQWQRNGAPIAGAAQRRYDLTAADGGQEITVRVWYTVNGAAVADKVSSTPVIPRFSSQTSVSWPSGLAAGALLDATVKATAAGVTPSGTVVLTDGSAEIGRATLVDGVAQVGVTLPRSVGSWTVSAHYLGSGLVDPSSVSFPLTLGKAASALEVKIGKSKLRPKQPKVKVAVASTGTLGTTIKVIFRKKGKKVTRKATLNAAGKAAVVLPKLPRGVHRIKVKYTGSATSLPATKIVKVRQRG
jgi:hypothetical protein